MNSRFLFLPRFRAGETIWREVASTPVTMVYEMILAPDAEGASRLQKNADGQEGMEKREEGMEKRGWRRGDGEEGMEKRGIGKTKGPNEARNSVRK